MHKNTDMKFPKEVQSIIEQVKREADIISIWFIGSRANNTHNLESDWDFICFFNRSIQEHKQRSKMVDIIQVGNDDKYLLEGQSVKMEGDFSKWNWRQVDSNSSQYISRKVPELEPGVPHNLDDVRYVSNKALKVWQANA